MQGLVRQVAEQKIFSSALVCVRLRLIPPKSETRLCKSLLAIGFDKYEVFFLFSGLHEKTLDHRLSRLRLPSSGEKTGKIAIKIGQLKQVT